MYKLDDLRRILLSFRRKKDGIEVECTECGNKIWVDAEEMYPENPDKAIEDILFALDGQR